MRLNKYLAASTGMSRRKADTAIRDGRVTINDLPASLGKDIEPGDIVKLDGQLTGPISTKLTIMLNKPVGYICSRDAQGGKSVYELLPENLHHLKPVGRLDKDSSGLLLMTNDGQLAYELTHPKFAKPKKYKIALNRDLSSADQAAISKGIMLEDGLSLLEITMINSQPKEWTVSMSEGRNRQIRRTFEKLGYSVVKLHRTHFGDYRLQNLPSARFQTVD